MDKISSAVKLPREERARERKRRKRKKKKDLSFVKIAHKTYLHTWPELPAPW